MAERMIRIERTILFNLDLRHLHGITFAILEDAKFFGMAEVLINLDTGF